MTTGFASNCFSFVRSHSLKLGTLAVLSMGLFLGGCNGKLKEENEALRTENADLKEKVTSADGEATSIKTQLQQTQAEKDRLAMELASSRNAQPQVVYQDPGTPNGPGRNYPKKPDAGRTERIVISGDVLFAPGQASLKPEAKKELSGKVAQLKGASSIIIEGYTDSDPITKAKAKYPTNQALSKARADSVKEYLVSRGISKSKISTVGKGASNPLASKKESRRVEIVVAE
jgi:outer membrane protein OmpA-like peptidoglycan-associated protein